MPNSDPMRVFAGSARPHEPFWTLRDAAESEAGEPELEFYGYISEYSWWDDDITPAQFKSDLYRLGNGGPITVRINSGGGDVIAASMIRAALVDYPGRVTVRIDGLCASAATFVAMAGDVVKMQDTAFFMIHDPAAIAFGTIAEVERVLDLLKTVKSGIIDAYAEKTKLAVDKLARMMTAETWMTAAEAVALGFVDEVIGGLKKPLQLGNNAAITNALRDFANVPAALQAMLAQPSADDEPGDTPRNNEAADRLRAEVKLIL